MKVLKILSETGEELEFEVREERLSKKVYNGIKTKTEKIIDAVVKHPIATIAGVVAAAEAISKILNGYAGVKRASVQQQELNKGKFEYYDRKRDLYYSLRRPMTNYENIEFSRRRRDGEDAGEILEDMNLI